MKTYNVCWSGGLDSTLIVTQLSKNTVRIRPFYIKGQTFRQSEPQELDSIIKNLKILRSDHRTKANIIDLEIIEKEDNRIKNIDAERARRNIYVNRLEEYKQKLNGHLPPVGSNQTYIDGGYISGQYASCASLARYLGETIELGLVFNDSEANIVMSCGDTIVEYDEATGRNVMRLTGGDKDVYTLFKDCSFPLLGQKLYKKDVWKWYENNNYTNVRDNTNSCQNPVIHSDGTYEPCGVCNPCVTLIRGDVLSPFTEEVLSRYRDYEKNHIKDPNRFRLKEF